MLLTNPAAAGHQGAAVQPALRLRGQQGARGSGRRCSSSSGCGRRRCSADGELSGGDRCTSGRRQSRELAAPHPWCNPPPELLPPKACKLVAGGPWACDAPQVSQALQVCLCGAPWWGGTKAIVPGPRGTRRRQRWRAAVGEGGGARVGPPRLPLAIRRCSQRVDGGVEPGEAPACRHRLARWLTADCPRRSAPAQPTTLRTNSQAGTQPGHSRAVAVRAGSRRRRCTRAVCPLPPASGACCEQSSRPAAAPQARLRRRAPSPAPCSSRRAPRARRPATRQQRQRRR